MKLLIHIGTQKTASTSIQHFCVHNGKFLKSEGYLYPRNEIHPFLFNFLPERLASGDQDFVARYLQQVRAQGRRENCHTVIISAESFYAMAFYYLYPREESRPAEYWQIEARLIEALYHCCDGYEEIEIACYLRPQDDFAAALYNQLVKISPYFTDSYQEFLETTRPIFDYDGHFRLWEKYFGAESISPKIFSSRGGDMVEDFFDSFLQPGLFPRARKLEHRSNLRLNRDVLEFKKIFNRSHPDFPLAFTAIDLHAKINSDFADQPGYQVFADLDDRKDFFGPFTDGNEKLCRRYGLGELPVIANRQDPTYPGLDAETAFEIYRRLQYLLDQPGTRSKLALRRIEHTLACRFPPAKRLLESARTFKAWLKSRI